MLGLFRKASAGPVRQNNPQQPSSGGTLDLSQRPYTRALLRTAEAAADSIREEAARAGFDLGETRPDQTDADGMIAYAVRLVTVHITLTALEKLGRTAEFVRLYPARRLPNDTPALMAYIAFVAVAVRAGLKGEGLELAAGATAGLSETMFRGWPRKEVNSALKLAHRVYNFVFDSNQPIIQEWLTDCSKYTTIYIEQHGIENTTLKDIDSPYLLGRLFQRLADGVVGYR